MPPVRQCAVGESMWPDEFEKVRAEVGSPPVPSDVLRSASVKARVIARDIAVHATTITSWRRQTRRSSERVLPAVVLLERVAVAVAVKVINHGIAFLAFGIGTREEQAVSPVLTEHTGSVDRVDIGRLRRARHRQQREKPHPLRYQVGMSLRI